MKDALIKALFVFLIPVVSVFGQDQGFLRLMSGSIFLKSQSQYQWNQIQADMSLRVGDSWKTSPDFQGSLYIGDSSVSLSASSFFHFRKGGLYQEKGGQWYQVSMGGQIPDAGTTQRFEGKRRGEFTPESYAFLTRPGEFENRKVGAQFTVFQGDIVQLPAFSRGDVKMIDGSSLQIRAGSAVEFGSEGVFLQSGSVFSTIRRRLSRFEVTTPEAVVAVRGTIFDVSHQDQTRVRVFDGVVKVNDRSGQNQSVFLNRGQQLDLSRRRQLMSRTQFNAKSRPDYSQAVVKRNVMQSEGFQRRGSQDSEREELLAIQRQLKEAKSRGFEEFIRPEANDQALRREALQEQQRRAAMSRESLQTYLQRVAKPGEDADFRIFQGGQASQGRVKMVESWKDDYRRQVQKSTEIQRQKIDSLARETKDRAELKERRETRSPIDLRTTVQKEDFQRRKIGDGVRNLADTIKENREILSIRTFQNAQNLEAKRIQQEQLKLTRDKGLIDRKITTIESNLAKNPDQRDALQNALTALRVQKRQLDTVQKNLTTRERNVENALKKADNRLGNVLSGFSGRFKADDRFNKDSRRILTGR